MIVLSPSDLVRLKKWAKRALHGGTQIVLSMGLEQPQAPGAGGQPVGKQLCSPGGLQVKHKVTSICWAALGVVSPAGERR